MFLVRVIRSWAESYVNEIRLTAPFLLQALLFLVAAASIALSIASSVPVSVDSVLLKSGVIVSNGTGGNYVPDGPAAAKVVNCLEFFVRIGNMTIPRCDSPR